MSQNLRTALIFGGFISLIGAAFYPIYLRPLMRLEECSDPEKEQAINRAGIVQEDVQPPGLKVWSDPFGWK
uniref:Small integral membrane protein 20 n=1 Tax=Moschus moschiferus TaxID=68415 RepID=A0A8C6E6M0_MOSMO